MGSRCRLPSTRLGFPTEWWRPIRIWPPTRLYACRPRMPSRLPRSSPGSWPWPHTTTSAGYVDATGVQIPGVLDDVYADARERALGVTWNGQSPSFALWAPTAKDVDLLVRPPGSLSDTRVDLRRDTDGVWSASGRPQWDGASYLYEVDVYVPSTGAVETNVVTDPYSLALTTNSQRSVVVNLDDAELKPSGWDDLAKPPLEQPEDSTIYELHLRDFSISDESVPAAERGTYRAFTHRGQQRHAAPAGARRRRHEHAASAAGVRHRDDPRGARRPRRAGVRPGSADGSEPGWRGAASVH